MSTTDEVPPVKSPSEEVNCMTLTYEYHKQPWAATIGSMSSSEIFSGTVTGIGSAAVGAVVAAALILGLPVAGLIQGYNSSGVFGALGGLTVGSVVGVLAGSIFAVSGALFCVFQIVSGVLRTPVTVWGHVTGRDWDSDAQEWIYYDLQVDANKTLSMSDDQYLVALAALGSTPAIFSQTTSNEIIQSKILSQSDEMSRKSVTDRELYDVLGVAPHASSNEIKKAYYVKAKQHHPDRNPGDVEAHKMFQKIGAAYQVLSDENLRAAYDRKGKEAMDNQSMMDAGALYALFFGSEQFEQIIGDLQVATQAKALMEHGISSIPVEQRKREVQLAVTLAKKLDMFLDGDVSTFTEKIKSEAVALSETTLGAALLGIIGVVYIDAAKREASKIEGFWSWIVSNGSAVFDGFNVVAAGMKAAAKAIELQQLQADTSESTEDPLNKTSPSNKSPLGQTFGPGPNATEQEIQQFRDTTKDMSIQLLHLFWLLVKFDINSTLSSVCKKVLRDNSVSAVTRSRRVEGLMFIGREYLARGADPNSGIDDIITRIGPQTGLFGDPKTGPDGFTNGNASFSETKNDTSHSTSTQENVFGGYDDEISVLELLRQVSHMSIKDLKIHIEQLGGNTQDIIEKSELQRRLRQLLLQKLSDEGDPNPNSSRPQPSETLSTESLTLIL